jgi:hypothetical protein
MVYVPAVLDEGVITPVVVFMLTPDGVALYVPPLNAPVPVNVTEAEFTVVQKGVPV